jgi:hypothetical protein
MESLEARKKKMKVRKMFIFPFLLTGRISVNSFCIFIAYVIIRHVYVAFI